MLVACTSTAIGLAVAHSFAEEGCNLRLAARADYDQGDVRQELQERYSVEVGVFQADLRDREALRGLADKNSDIDILVNNFGDIRATDPGDISDEALRDAFFSKVDGYISLSRHVYRNMKSRRGGVIVNCLDVLGDRLNAINSTGSAANAALIAFTRAAGSESITDRIRFIGIDPGAIEPERQRAEMLRTVPHPSMLALSHLTPARAIKPREIADIIAFAASGRCPSLSGSVLTIDGRAGAR